MTAKLESIINHPLFILAWRIVFFGCFLLASWAYQDLRAADVDAARERQQMQRDFMSYREYVARALPTKEDNKQLLDAISDLNKRLDRIYEREGGHAQ